MTLLNLCGYLWSAWFIYWMLAARNTKKTAESESRFSRLLHIVPLCLGFVAIFSSSFDYGVLRQPLPFAGIRLQMIGVALTAAGLGFSIWARVHLGKNWSGTVTLKEGHELIRTGPYSLARHPIYTGLTLAALGSALTAGKLGGVPGTLLIIACFALKMRTEERFMRRQFGEQYERYRREVRALVPFVI